LLKLLANQELSYRTNSLADLRGVARYVDRALPLGFVPIYRIADTSADPGSNRTTEDPADRSARHHALVCPVHTGATAHKKQD
jgi:hypothetical protein